MTKSDDRALSDLDRRLLAMLREDSRQPVTKLAGDLGLSRANVYARLSRLEELGVIGGYTVRLGESYDRRLIRAQVMIKVAPKESRAVEAALRAIPEVRVLHSVSGDFDMIAVAATASVARMDEVIDSIGHLPGVERTTSSIILSTKFDR